MDRLQNASILYNFIYEYISNEEEFDYDSLQIELQNMQIKKQYIIKCMI